MTVDDVLDHSLPAGWRQRRRGAGSRRVRVLGRSRRDLTTPHSGRRVQLGLFYDPDAFGRFSESIARFLGTARYLVYQTALVIGWIGWNIVAPDSLQFDPYDRGLVLLTLVLSLQASYAAPLILLAQNRQAERDGEGPRSTARSTPAPRPTPSSWPARWPASGSPCPTS